jgi:hypothetical protein
MDGRRGGGGAVQSPSKAAAQQEPFHAVYEAARQQSKVTNYLGLLPRELFNLVRV